MTDLAQPPGDKFALIKKKPVLLLIAAFLLMGLGMMVLSVFTPSAAPADTELAGDATQSESPLPLAAPVPGTQNVAALDQPGMAPAKNAPPPLPEIKEAIPPALDERLTALEAPLKEINQRLGSLLHEQAAIKASLADLSQKLAAKPAPAARPVARNLPRPRPAAKPKVDETILSVDVWNGQPSVVYESEGKVHFAGRGERLRHGVIQDAHPGRQSVQVTDSQGQRQDVQGEKTP